MREPRAGDTERASPKGFGWYLLSGAPQLLCTSRAASLLAFLALTGYRGKKDPERGPWEAQPGAAPAAPRPLAAPRLRGPAVAPRSSPAPSKSPTPLGSHRAGRSARFFFKDRVYC